MTLNELKEKRAALWAEQEDVLTRTTEATSGEDRTHIERIDAELDNLEPLIQAAEASEARRKVAVATEPTPAAAITSDNPEDREAAYSTAFDKWLRFGHDGLDPEDRMVLRGNQVDATGEKRALTITTTAGGYLVPEGFSGQLTEALAAYGGVRKVANVIRTSSGNPLPWPTIDDTSNTGEIIDINTAANEQDTAYGVVTLGAFKYSSKMIKVPLELLQDSFFDINAHLAKQLTTRLGRITNSHFTTGAGTTLPKGVTVASSAGVTSASATAVTFDDLTNLEHSVDPEYRESASYMFKDSTFKLLKLLKDADGRPIWQPDVAGGSRPTINGYPYTVNQAMPAATTGLVSVVFGDFSYYVIRDVMDVSVIRLDERYAELAQVAFLAWSRHDGQGVAGESSFGPLKRLTQA